MRRPPPYIPQALPGWGPQTYPERPKQQSTMAPRILTGLLLFILVTAGLARLGVLERPNGWVAVPITCLLLVVLYNSWAAGRWRAVGQALLSGVAIAGLALVLLSGTSTPPKVKPEMVKVEASQTDLTERASEWWAKAYQRLLAQGGADPKEGR